MKKTGKAVKKVLKVVSLSAVAFFVISFTVYFFNRI